MKKFFQEFSQAESLIYLNHAAVAPWPRRTADAVASFARENQTEGARHYPRWLQTEAELRDLFAWLINAPSSDDVALLKNTSEGLSLVAYGIGWRAGENVVTSLQEFPSNRIVWESLRDLGVEVRLADLNTGSTPEDQLFACCDQNTRLLSVSSVQYASGLRMNLDHIGGFCREKEILFCVDAIQSLGALPFDVQACRADFVVADGHKWMLGPEGVALFFCRAPHRQRLRLRQYGWHMVEHQGDYERRDWLPAASARRFECGSPNMLGIHALRASLSLLREVGIDSVSGNILKNSSLLIDFIKKRPDKLRLLSDASPARRSGIVTFRSRDSDQTPLYRHLQDNGVICAQRGGGIRLSPHFYNTEGQLQTACGLIDKFVA